MLLQITATAYTSSYSCYTPRNPIQNSPYSLPRILFFPLLDTRVLSRVQIQTTPPVSVMKKRHLTEENLSANGIPRQRVPLGAITGFPLNLRESVCLELLPHYCQMMISSEMPHHTRQSFNRAIKLGGKVLMEKVCCNNVRTLFNELPTPHLIVEITPFPSGPLTESDYAKADKLERVLRSGPSV